MNHHTWRADSPFPKWCKIKRTSGKNQRKRLSTRNPYFVIDERSGELALIYLSKRRNAIELFVGHLPRLERSLDSLPCSKYKLTVSRFLPQRKSKDLRNGNSDTN